MSMSYKKFDRDLSIEHLVAEFETMSEKGTVAFLDEKNFLRLIEYYENECVFERALEATEYALQHHGFSADFYIKKAQLLIDCNQSKQALHVLEKAEAFAPSELLIPLLRAEAFTLLGFYDAAFELLEQLKNNCTNKTELSAIYTIEALVYEKLEQHERMFYSLKKAALEDPNNREALERLWLCVEISKKYTESVYLHEEILDLDPYSYMAWYNLGHAQAYLGNYEQAIEAYEYAFIIEEKFEYAYRDCAEMCITINRYKKALECYQEVLKFFEPDADLFLKIGQCYQALNDYTIARTFYHKAISSEPYNDEIYFHIGECYAMESEWNKALRYYDKAVRIEDNREEYYAALAEAYYQIGDYEKATSLFKTAIELAPDQSQYWIHYASYLMEIGDGEKGIKVLNEADLYAVGTELLYCRVACLFIIGRRQEAKYYLSEALTEDFEMHDSLFALAPDLQYDKDVLDIIKFYNVNF